MIFVTIGTQEPFDRLIMEMDAIAPSLNERIIAQVSGTSYKARNMETHRFLSPSDCDKFYSDARIIVGHAGMGTIISALVRKKPILILPRRADLGEHRNDHQLATAQAFEAFGYVNVVYHEKEIGDVLKKMIQTGESCKHELGEYASDELISSIHDFISS